MTILSAFAGTTVSKANIDISLTHKRSTGAEQPPIISGSGLCDSMVSEMMQDVLGSLPCIVYECTAAGQLIFVSENVSSLLGVSPQELRGKCGLWEDRVFPQDLGLFRQKRKDLDNNGSSITLVHRLINRWGLPVWVNHGLKKLSTEDGYLVRGCLLPIGDECKVRELGHTAVDLFLHKLSNHFTLLRVILGSLHAVLRPLQATKALDETMERAINLTRSFAEYNQQSSCSEESINMAQVIEAALLRVHPMFVEKGVFLTQRVDNSLEMASVTGDPSLLELATSHILQNALEATTQGNEVTLQAWAEAVKELHAVVRVRITDRGLGMEGENIDRVLTPFYSTKEGHEGLGLTIANRFVELHGGLLHVTSQVATGTVVDISLPAGMKGDGPMQIVLSGE